MRAPAVISVALALAAGCAPRSVVRPSGAKSPLGAAEAAPIVAEATRACDPVRTLTAEVRFSGRVGRQKIRGRGIVGVRRPASLRLEGVAPFGPPAFILVAQGARGTLLLPRDNRVLRDAPPDEILHALTGVTLTPDSLRALLAGCFMPAGAPPGGTKFGDRWVMLEWPQGGTAYARRDGTAWRLVGATVGALDVEYDEFADAHPRRLWLRTKDAAGADLRLTLSQVELNVALGDDAFEVKIPADADPLTLDELRAAGPLGQK